MATRADLQAKFEAFHARKPWIYDRFCETCDLLIARGVTSVSSTMVLEAVKLAQLLKTGEHTALPNDLRAYYAKKWLDEHKNDPGVPWRFFRMTARYDAPKESTPISRAVKFYEG